MKKHNAALPDVSLVLEQGYISVLDKVQRYWMYRV